MARKACALRASHGLLRLSPGPSPGREGEAAHRRTEHPTNTNRTPNTDRKLVQTGNPVQIEKLAQIGKLVQIENLVQIGDISCGSVSPFPRGGASGDVKNHGEPEGRKPESHTKTLTKGGLPPEAVKPPHIGGGLEEVDVSLLLSLRQRK